MGSHETTTPTTTEAVERVADCLRDAYRDGIPAHDLIGVLGIIAGHLHPSECDAIAPVVAEIARGDGEMSADEVRDLLAMAAPDDVAPVDHRRVAARLAGGGWPLGDVTSSPS